MAKATTTELIPAGVSPVKYMNDELSEGLALAKDFYPKMCASAEAAHTAGMAWTRITSDEEDRQVELLAAKIRTTYTNVEGMRKQITVKTDLVKEISMRPEKLISTDAKTTGSAFVHLVKLRNAYANEKEAKRQDDLKRIALDNSKREEITRVSNDLARSAAIGVSTLAGQVASITAEAWGALTLAGITEFQSLLSKSPFLKKDTYTSWFSVPYNPAYMDADTYNRLKEEAMQQYGYGQQNAAFIEKVAQLRQPYVTGLPQRISYLEQLQQIAQQDASRASELETQRVKSDAVFFQDQQTQLLEEQAQLQQSITQDLAADQMNDAFTTQAAVQEVVDTVAGTRVRIATFSCEEEAIVVTMSKLFLACFTHPKFEGIIERDAQGILKHDPETGRPVYKPWVESLLKFWATNCATPIDGLTISERIKTTQRA